MSSLSFMPMSALAGGVLIGGAATMLLAVNGRLAGVSGVAGGLLRPMSGDIAWRVLFILGLVLGAGLWRLASPWPLTIRVEAPLPVLLLGGLLVGFGTQLGRGCTSGHGVCGIARLSARSAVATLAFLASGIATVFVVRHLLGG
jgi:uncharacterized membrane protein YedE/YeeE